MSRVPSAAVVEADQSDADVKVAVYDLILQVSQAHQAHCGFTEESVRGLVRKPMIIPVSYTERERERGSFSYRLSDKTRTSASAQIELVKTNTKVTYRCKQPHKTSTHN